LEKETISITFAFNNINMSVKKFQPEYLKPGDEVAIISPAFAIEDSKVEEAVKFLENWRVNVHVGKNALKKNGPFAGTDKERLSDFQAMTDNKRIKAIFCSRGGYGMLKIIDRIDLSSLKRDPKWYVGFSDITVLHLWLSEKIRIVSVHGEMPLNYSNPEKATETFESLYYSLFGGWKPVKWQGDFIRPTEASGEVTGGNISMIYSLTGTPAEPKTKGRILFIEEVGEYYYHLDRMLTSLKMAGKLKDLAALVTGGFSKMEETKTPWGKSPEEIISDIVAEYDYPVLFNFPAGHIPDNRAFYIGKQAKIKVKGRSAMLSYL
jgi:muramoyltetrapeptide carboxypeptidase